MSRGTIALAIAIGDVVGWAIACAAGLTAGSEFLTVTDGVLFFGIVMAFSSMGVILIRRVPDNPIGVLLLTVATVQVVGPLLAAWAFFGESASPAWPGAALAGAFGDVMYIAPLVIALVGIPLLFPDGRLPSRRFRWVVWVTIVTMAAQCLPGLLSLVSNTGDGGAIETIIEVAGVASLGAAVFGFGGAMAAVWVRYRRGEAVQRQQLKWLLAVAAVAAVAFPAALALQAVESPLNVVFWVIGGLAYFTLPVAIGIAILRYHLYDIDVIINRALVYVPLTAMVAGFYAATVALSGRLLAAVGGSSDLAIVLTTLVVVMIFTPVKNAVQAAVDQRFKVAPHPAEPVPGTAIDPADLLVKLGGLRDAGLLTSAEFDAKKGDILARI